MTRAFVPAERTQSTRCRASRILVIIAAKIYSSTPRVVSSHIRVLDVGWVIVTRARAFLEGALLSLASMVSPRTSGSARGSLAAVLSFVALVSASAVAGDGDPASAFPTATDRGFAAWLARVGGELSEEVVLAHVEGGGRGVFAKDAAQPRAPPRRRLAARPVPRVAVRPPRPARVRAAPRHRPRAAIVPPGAGAR